jgi:hypothetical protein
MLALVTFLAKQAGILAVDSDGDRLTVADTKLTDSEQKTASLRGDQDAKQV